MAAAAFNIIIEQGATYAQRFFIVNQSDLSPFDLTLYDNGGIAQIRETAKSTSILGTFTVTLPNPRTSGEIDLSMAYTNTTLIPLGTKDWDLIIKSSTLGFWRILAGKASVIPIVSK